MPLLERESQLASLRQYAAEARGRAGRLVLVSGEAGVGKSSLVEELQDELRDATWVWGACDGLFTPRPLAPLRDVARAVGGELLEAVRAGLPRDEVFDAALRWLEDAQDLVVLVVEDVQWADDATLDLLRFLGRRLRDLPVLLVVTFRDDALAPADTLRVALGELTGQRWTRRIDLAAALPRRRTPAGRGHDVPPRGAAPAHRRQPVLPGRGARLRRRRGARLGPRRGPGPRRPGSTRPPGRRSRSPRSTATGSTRTLVAAAAGVRSRRSTSWSRPAC